VRASVRADHATTGCTARRKDHLAKQDTEDRSWHCQIAYVVA
jgi:hypothetical protein